MSRGIFIIGTDTGVGKTVVSAGLMYLLLQNKYRAAYFKPVASGEVEEGGARFPADAAFVRMVSGFEEKMETVVPFSFADAVAPHLASRRAGRRIDPNVIRRCLDDLKSRYDVIVAEGAGGLAVPLNDEGLMQYDLIRELGFPCLLVARTGLGTINHTLLTLAFARSAGLAVKGIVFGAAEQNPVDEDNMAVIKKLSGLEAIFAVPVIDGIDPDKMQCGNLKNVFEDNIHIQNIVHLMETI